MLILLFLLLLLLLLLLTLALPHRALSFEVRAVVAAVLRTLKHYCSNRNTTHTDNETLVQTRRY